MSTAVMTPEPQEAAAIAQLTTIPANSLAFLNQIGVIDSEFATEGYTIQFHENAKPIEWTRRQIQMALVNGGDDLANLYKQVEEEAEAVFQATDASTKQGLATLKTLAVNVTKAKTTLAEVESSMKKAIDAAMELPTKTKKDLIAHAKTHAAAIDVVRDRVRMPVTLVEEHEKKQKKALETLLARLEDLTNVGYDPINHTYTPSTELQKRLDDLPSMVPPEFKSHPKVLAAYQDAEKRLPDIIAIARMQERKDAEAQAAIDAAKKAEAKAEAMKEVVQDAFKSGADIGNTLGQISQPQPVEMPQPQEIAPPQPQRSGFGLEQRKTMAGAWVSHLRTVCTKHGFHPEEPIPAEILAVFKSYFNDIGKGQVPYLAIEWSE
ncbi:hypothetical protein [Vitreoscilla stercoraria]|uniref:Uncharacterized protein n=1 Tax=Vitreoscilla stercoraria TaxID=61 RepID=A0ABY4EC83_VITST|nr:hypothetical protein [Vitreoscilla stercoraria]UOO93354.1 hypothetical protein LVJ81_04825 [Vitreoscilla stercoraria]